MKTKKRFAWLLMLLTSFAVCVVAHAQVQVPYKLVTTIKVPGDLSGVFDISWVDSEAGRYYVTDRGTVSVDVIDTKNLTYLYSLLLGAPGNGVVTIHLPDQEPGELREQLWVGDNNSNVEVFDLPNGSLAASISTGGIKRADELAYDPLDHIILVANDQETTCDAMGACTGSAPFVTFISTDTFSVLGKIYYPNTVFGSPTAAHGLEQPVWNAKTRKFYLAVPGTMDNPNGEIDEIDPLRQVITKAFPTTCGPAGLALIPSQRLMTSCGDVLAVASGKVLTTVPNVSPADEIWFNPGDERVSIGGIFGTPVVNGVPPYRVIANLPWMGFFTPPPPQFSHSVAADFENNRIFVPVSNLGVLVFTQGK